MHRLHVFNPDHDYALAHGGANYIAPAKVRTLASELELLPCIWGEDEDYLLLSDGSIIRLDFPEESVSLSEIKVDSVEPWGWDASLKNKLKALGIPESCLPSDQYIENLRRLSHRRISIDACRFLNCDKLPKEFFKIEDALQFFHTYPGCYFKLPWSSGGRGVLATRELRVEQVKEWLTGAIRRQGSVMAEEGAARILDFGSLWEIADDCKVNFRGFSVSVSDGRGKYKGNIAASQEILAGEIRRVFPEFNLEIIDRQKAFIENKIADHYKGKMGIDMMADSNGRLYPCVEINLRTTMGHVALDFETMPPERRRYFVGKNLPILPYPF